MDKTRRISRLSAAAVLAVSLGVGGYAFAASGTNSQAAADTYTGPVAESVAPPAQDDAAAQSIYDQQVAHAKAEAEAAAAQAAAEQAAAQAAADAAAKATEPVTQGLPAGSRVPRGPALPGDTSGPGGTPLGQPLVGQCASNSASTGADGESYCD